MADETEENLVVLVKKPNATSIVWNYFGLEANKGGTPKPDKNPICRSCKRSISAKGGNTSNLMAHLKEHHTELYVYTLKRFQLRSPKTKERMLLTVIAPPLVVLANTQLARQPAISRRFC